MIAGKSAKELAEGHWAWLEPLLEFPLSKDKAEYLYITAMIHGYKHRREDEDSDNKER